LIGTTPDGFILDPGLLKIIMFDVEKNSATRTLEKSRLRFRLGNTVASLCQAFLLLQ
jgi:hypothetical protein